MALTLKAESEGTSVNQLCLMYLSASLASNHHLGTDELNHRLNNLALLSLSDDVLFAKLKQLNDEVNLLVPHLLDDLKNIYVKKKSIPQNYFELLRFLYPISQSDSPNETFPWLNIPTVKIVLSSTNNTHIDINNVKKILSEHDNNISVSYGDYDFYIPSIKQRLPCELAVTIDIYYPFDTIQQNAMDIKKQLISSFSNSSFNITIRPCYLCHKTRYLLLDSYPELFK